MTAPKQEEHEEDTLPPGYYQERELVKLLLLYGSNILSLKRMGEDGQVIEEQVTVAQLIVDDLLNDGIQFNDPVNQRILNVYDEALNTDTLPNDHFFTSNEDPQIAQQSIDLLSTPYKLDRWEKHGIFVKTEEDKLIDTIEDSLLRYKDQIIEAKRKEIQKQIKETQDLDRQLELMKQKKYWDDLKVRFNEKLGIVIVK